MKTHYRKAFNSPYLSSADIVEPTTLNIAKVVLEKDKTNKTKDSFNTAYFKEKEIRPGEKLKPMILNAHNSQVMKEICGSPFIDDWSEATVTVYVDHNVKFGRETVEGLRLQPGPAYISADQATEITDLMKEVGADESAFLNWLGADSVENIPTNKYQQAKSGLEMKREGN